MSNQLVKISMKGIMKGDFFTKIAHFLYKKLLHPRSRNDDLRRREFIFNIIVVVSFCVTSIFSLFIFYNSITLEVYRGFPFTYSLLLVAFFAFLWLLSRKGAFILASYLLIETYLILTSYSAFQWGFDLPQILLTYSLLIIMAGILISTRFAFEITLVISLIIMAISYFHINNIVAPQSYWRGELPEMNDAVEFSITFIVIAVISWLSNREIENSLRRARKSEAELKKERDMLEVRVQERTEELERSQAEKIYQASRFIEFGRISSGLFHDLVNYLNFLFLNIEQAAEASEKEMDQMRNSIKQADETRMALTEYIESAKRQFQDQKDDSWFLLNKEILSIIKILNYRFTIEKIKVNLEANSDIVLYGNAVRFNHVLTNIILNSLDAYELIENRGDEKVINIHLKKGNQKAVVTVEDFAGGIPMEIQDKIFESFFTTKTMEKGSGIGLSTVKKIIEEDFAGTIGFKSTPGKGTKFIIEFPIRNED